MSDIRILKVSEDDDGQRLDRWLKRVAPDLPYVTVQKLLRKGQIRIDGSRAKPDQKLISGQQVRVPPHRGEEKSEKKAAKQRPLSEDDKIYAKSLVVYQDKDIIAINKPAGLAVQGGTGQKRHLDQLIEGLSDKDGVKPRLVHRLDKDTSGLLLLARSAKAAKALGYIFKGRDIKKIYYALVTTLPEISEGTIKAPLSKGGGLGKEKMRLDEEDGKYAATEYKLMDRAGDELALMAFWPRTGRTHQIRVHAQLGGFPILGDGKYGGTSEILKTLEISKRLHLHAAKLIFKHPFENRQVDLDAPLPQDLTKSWKSLGFDTKFKADPFMEMDYKS